MWFPFLGKIVPFLLASRISSSWPPQSATDLSESFEQIFSDLERPGPIHRNDDASSSPAALRFSYVSPPLPSTGESTWKRDEIPDDSLYPNPSKPIAVYLPGLDGYGMHAPHTQFDDLARVFDLWRLTILPEDRSSFTTVVRAVADFVKDVAIDGRVEQQHQRRCRDVVLIGESSGGVFAAAVALHLQKSMRETASSPVRGLVLASPATSFDETPWDRIVPMITSLGHDRTTHDENSREHALPSPYSVIGGLFLASLLPDNDQYRRIIDLVVNLPGLDGPTIRPDQIRDVYDAATNLFRVTGERLPPDLIEHRVEWLTVGSSVVNSRLGQLEVPTLVVVGDEDKLLPSAKAVDRLVEELPMGEKLVVSGRGHLVLDEDVNLTEAILYSKIDPLKWKNDNKPYDPILDWALPPAESINKIVEDWVKPLRTIHSPIFISTDTSGKRRLGLSKVPRSDGPLLLVGNHQFLAVDLRLLVYQLLQERNILARGLAHSSAFRGNKVNELYGRTPGLQTAPNSNPITKYFQDFGAVLVSPKNYYRLLETGQDTMLFPGGAVESLHGNKSYPLLWPEKADFVRTATKFNATIIPLSAVGMLDGVNVHLEAPEVVKLPIIGPYFSNYSNNVEAARYDQKKEDELLALPLFTPKMPARNYFLFGAPIETRDIDHRDRDACGRVYQMVRANVREGLDDLLRVRKHDPFGDTITRLAYERTTGKQAPTFSIEKLNRGSSRWRRR